MDADAIEFLESFPVRNFKKGEFIIHQGTPATCVYFLAKGTAERNVCTASGDEISHGERKAGETASCLLGALSFYSVRKIHESSFRAKTACACHVIPEAAFMGLLQNRTDMLNELLSLAVRNYDRLNANFCGKMRGLASARIATYLLNHSRWINDRCTMDEPLNMSKIAREVGMHRITVGKIVNALADAGVISYNGASAEIVSVEALCEYENGTRKLEYRQHR